MRETSCLGISVFVTVTLLACIACPRPAAAQSPAPAVETVSDAGATPPLVEPVADLPSTPAPQIDATNLFPNEGEIAPALGFNDQRFGYVLHGEARATYESNLFIQPDHEESDISFRISPGVAIGLGEFKSELDGADRFRYRFERYIGKNYLYVDYSPSYTWYLDHGSLDSLDHDARLVGEWAFQRLTLAAKASYITQVIPVQDIGDRVKEKRLSAELTARYELTGKIFLDVGGFYDGYDYDHEGVASREWRNEDWLDYQVSPKVRMGAGWTMATVDRDGFGEQDYQQARLRFMYEASEKLTIGLYGGVEWRQAEGIEDRALGTFQLDVAWNPFDGSYFYLRGFRESVTSSIDGSEYSIATGVNVQYRQRLLQRFYFDLMAGYQNEKFESTTNSSSQGRTDNSFFVRPGVGFDVARWLNCEIGGEYRQNDSTQRFGYDSTKATVRFNLLF